LKHFSQNVSQLFYFTINFKLFQAFLPRVQNIYKIFTKLPYFDFVFYGKKFLLKNTNICLTFREKSAIINFTKLKKRAKND